MIAIRHARLLPMTQGLTLLDDGALVIRDGVVAWLGDDAALDATGLEVIDARGALVTPGLVDCHAHPIFGGDRTGEFALRARGAGYLEIARAGGGIVSTVKATRAATDAELLASTKVRLARALATGTTTMEAKTGYALDVGGELRLLRLLSQVDTPLKLVPTLLGAHAVGPGADRDAWVDACAGELLDGARGQAYAVDVYCDEGAFTLAETRRILEAAKARGFAVKAHAGQFADLGAAGLVAELGGVSADHLEQVSVEQCRQMAAHGVTAVLLASACVQLKLPPPPVSTLRAAGVGMALGSDLNPGSSHTSSLPLQMWLATTHLGMSVEEAWLGVTVHGARAAGRPHAGRLEVGAPGDVVVWDAEDPAAIPYSPGTNLVAKTVVAGRVVVV
jgi:imidazolonepropionase